VIESTGRFTTGSAAKAHLEAGAKKVIISAPAKEEDITIVMGVNDDAYDPEAHHILVQRLLHHELRGADGQGAAGQLRLVKGLMTTIHAYTNDQVMPGLPAQGTCARARARGAEHHPDHDRGGQGDRTGAAGAEGQAGRLAMRVPVVDGSVTDLVVELGREVTQGRGVNAAYRAAAEGTAQGIPVLHRRPDRVLRHRRLARVVHVRTRRSRLAFAARSRSSAGTTTSGGYSSRLVRPDPRSLPHGCG